MATLADILRQTGYVQDGKLATPAPIESPMTKVLADHIASLPQKTAQNIEQMNWMVQNSNPYDYTGGKNPYYSYDPKAAEEFANYVPNLMGSIAALPAAERMLLAQRNAALPVSEGGLGLAANNTAAQRAKALGYTDEAYHGSDKVFEQFDPSLADTRRKTGTPVGAIVVSSNPKTASTYTASPDFRGGEWITNYAEGGNVMPLLIKKEKNISMNAASGSPDYTPYWNDVFDPKYPGIETTNEFAKLAKEKGKKTATIKNVKDNALPSGAEGDTTFIFDPSLIRSRFAAFDPKRSKEADILAAGLAVPMPKEDKKKTRKELLEQELKKRVK